MNTTTTIRSLIASSLALALLAGCGGSDRSYHPSASTGAGITTATNPTPTTPGTNPGTTTNLVDAHGEVVAQDAQGGGSALAVRLDGQADAMEIADASQLKAAKVRVGTTITFSASVDDNTAGSTTLTKSVDVSAFQADEVMAYGRMIDRQGAILFRTVKGRTYTPAGPLAVDLMNHPQGRPVFVSGTTGSVAGDLTVTSWRPTTEIGFRLHMGVFGIDERLTVLDLERRGAYVYKRTSKFLGNARGSGLLPEADRAYLQSLVVGANLPNQPTSFKPTGPVILILRPKVEITGVDTTTDVQIEIDQRAKLPAELEALVDNLKDTMRDTPRVRDLVRGSYGKIKTETTRTSLTSSSFKKLWKDSGTSKTIPSVEFKDAFVVGAFRGRTSSPGASIVVDDVERIGDDLYVTTRKTNSLVFATPKKKLKVLGTSITIPLPLPIERSPYAIAAVDQKGVKGKIYVDGKRVLKFPQILQLLPKLPLLPLAPKPKPTPKPPLVVFPKPKPLITLFPPKPKPQQPKVGAGVSVSLGFGTKFKLK